MENILNNHKGQFESMMNALPFVDWDRYSGDEEVVSVYGWIDRDEDSYKDFVIIGVDKNGDSYYDTSSAKYSAEIHKLLAMQGKHSDCQRVEDFFDVKNAVKLNPNKVIKFQAYCHQEYDKVLYDCEHNVGVIIRVPSYNRAISIYEMIVRPYKHKP